MRGHTVVAGNVATIRLASAPPLGEWLTSELARIREDQSVHVVLLDARGLMATAAALEDPVLGTVTGFDLPVIAAFEAAVDGAVSTLTIAADIRICDVDSTFAAGPSESPWAWRRLRTLIGDGAALRLLRAGETLEAAALLRSGLVSEAAPAGESYPRAARLASVIASRGPIATRLAKEAIWRGLELPFDHALRMETDLTLLLQTTKDRAEGVRAFLEKRPPQFTGE